MLDAALAVARRFTGWHVSPVETAQSITMDGPDSRVLWLPTLKVVTLTSVTEDTVLLDPTKVTMSAGDGPGLPRRVALRKTSHPRSWSRHYGAITVVMDHGYTEVEAVEWRQAILSMVDQMSQVPVMAAIGQSPIGMRTKDIDDVRYQWAPQYGVMAENVLFSVTNILEDFKIPDLEFF